MESVTSQQGHYSGSAHTIENHRRILESLEQACEWIGDARGRAKRYGILIEEFWAGTHNTREHVLVHNEAYEIVDVFRSWNASISDFPGLKEKIAAAFDSGAILSEDEKPLASSNRSRNDMFVYYLAGELLEAGVEVISVDECVKADHETKSTADIVCNSVHGIIEWQCKRPQSLSAVPGRMKKARKQLRKSEDISGGVIGLDCSAFIRPVGMLVERSTSHEAAQFYENRLQDLVFSLVQKELRSHVLGVYLFARGPSMIPTEISPILSRNGKAFQQYRPESVVTHNIVNNPTSANPEALRIVYEALNKQMKNVKA